MPTGSRILIVDEDPTTLQTLDEFVREHGYTAETAAGGHDGLMRLSETGYSVLLVNVSMEAMDGLDFLRLARAQMPEGQVVAMGARRDSDQAIAAMRAGANDFVGRPCTLEEILLAVERGLKLQSLEADNRRLQEEVGRPFAFENIIGEDERMRAVYQLIEAVARTASTVLITGESGTGKELVSSAIHYQSDRSQRPFVKVNCSSFAEGLLESELFGHEKGAFTGAVRRRAGMFQRADGGTLFLDEVGELSPSVQVKLLRVLQEREIVPVGSDDPIQVDVRLLAATHRDLQAEVAAGRFRQDLFFRLNVIPIHLPPLRERTVDVSLLANHFLRRYRDETGKRSLAFSADAMRALEQYPWPGNVRELQNLVERAVVLCRKDHIDLSDLPPEVACGSGAGPPAIVVHSERLADVEELLIRRVLGRTDWNITQSAKVLGITRATLYSKIKRYGLHRK